MLRTILGVIAGLVAWLVIVTLLNLGLRYGWPAYHAAEPAMTFSLQMMQARLAESFVASILAAIIAVRAAPASAAVPWILGVVMLGFFIPVHYYLWPKFPVWYHLTFLASLPVLSVVAGSMARPRTG
jgi:hypothetical protein